MVGQVHEITEAEAELYDRQIRLWGLDAQKRLRSSSVLVAGIKGLGAEISKNIVLAGIKSLVVLDHTEVSQEDGAANFFALGDDIGKNRAMVSAPRIQQLNPMVDVSADVENLVEKSDEFFIKFDVICVTCCDTKTIIRINELCRKHRIKFFAGEVNGFFGYMFADLGEHHFVQEKILYNDKVESENGSQSSKFNAGSSETKIIKQSVSFTSFAQSLEANLSGCKGRKMIPSVFINRILLKFRDNFNRCPNIQSRDVDVQELSKIRKEFIDEMDDSFASCCFAEISPVCAIVGGIIGQEIIKAVSLKDKPHDNYFFYDGLNGTGLVQRLK